MSWTQSAHPAAGARPDAPGARASPRLASWLGLAATPTFAVMALLTAVPGRGPMEMLCAEGPMSGAMSALSGMAPMYLLMSAFHSPPWLKLIFSRRGGGR